MKFSIILPTYNRAQLLPRAVNSVLEQTYSNWELIIVDDGSTDNTKNVVEKFLSKDQRIKFISYRENRGVNFARNRGIERSTGDVITFLDSDDKFFIYTLAKAEEFIRNYPNFDLYAFSTECEKEKKRLSFVPYDGYTPSYKDVVAGKVEGEFLIFAKRYIFNEFKFYEDLNGFEGLTWWHIIRKFRIIYSTIVLRTYNRTTESLTRVKKKDKKFWMNVQAGMERKLEFFGADLRNWNFLGRGGYLHSLFLLWKSKLLSKLLS